MPVPVVRDDALGAVGHVDGEAVLVPGDLGAGRGVDDADDLGLVALAGVDEGLLLVDLGGVCKKKGGKFESVFFRVSYVLKRL